MMKTVAQAREIGSQILIEQGFTRGYNGLDVATWGHPDGRIGRLQYEPDFAGDPELVRKVKFQPPNTAGILPEAILLVDFS